MSNAGGTGRFIFSPGPQQFDPMVKRNVTPFAVASEEYIKALQSVALDTDAVIVELVAQLHDKRDARLDSETIQQITIPLMNLVSDTVKAHDLKKSDALEAELQRLCWVYVQAMVAKYKLNLEAHGFDCIRPSLKEKPGGSHNPG